MTIPTSDAVKVEELEAKPLPPNFSPFGSPLNDRVGGWAPGKYICQCMDCGGSFGGDKRAIQCLTCAIASTTAQAEAARAEMRAPLAWPSGSFSVNDPAPDDDHSPLYLQFPNGLMVNVSCDPTPGLDVARCHWMVSALNDALNRRPPSAPAIPEELVRVSERATKGPWEARFRFGARTTVGGRQRFPICDTATAPRGEAPVAREEANAAFIVSCVNFVRQAIASSTGGSGEEG